VRSASQRGFTLLEVVLALSIVGALLVIMFGGLRVGLGAWSRGEDRAELLEHERNVDRIVDRTLAGTYLYRPETGPDTTTGILFKGEPDKLSFVTVAPPVPPSVPIAFTAVTLSLETGDTPGLAVRQKPLPNEDPFAVVPPVFVDPAVTALRFRYLREAGDDWEERWDPDKEKSLPVAIEVTLSTQFGGRRIDHPALVIPLRVTPS
jgi:general secretion pathway protein J